MDEILDQKEDILNQIKFMKNTAPEELLSIIHDSLSLYLKCLTTFGFGSNEAEECLLIVKEMTKIFKKERKLLKSIESSIESIDLDLTCDIIDILDKLNEDTYNAYDNILGEIETSCYLKERNRVLRPRAQIDSLITNDEYENMVIKLTNKKKKRS